MAENSTPNEFEAAAEVPTVGVGQTLKTARERMGRALPDVASQLRIRQPFLHALEEGRHRDLPGGTYAIGFLRTYAEFLGLDGEEMVRRFRAEAAGEFATRSELMFPLPTSEGRIPGGAVLFMGLVAAAVAYGGWYWLSSRQSTVAEAVPPLPERLNTVLNRPAGLPLGTAADPAKPAAADAASPAPAAPGKESEMVPPSEGEEEGKAQGQQSGQQSGQQPAPPPVAAAPQNAPVQPAPVQPAPAQGGGTQTVPAQTAPVSAPAPAPVQNQKAPAQGLPAPAPVSAPAPAAVPQAPTKSAAPEPAPAEAAKPNAAQEHAESRIRLSATADDCWVQIREMDGQLTLSRLLRRGESVAVPNRPGLSLMVGNAGALEVSVDGKKAPALGTAGQIRRDIKLDPDKLLGGG